MEMISDKWQITKIGDIADITDCLHAKKPDRKEQGKVLLNTYNIGKMGKLNLNDLYLISDEDFYLWTKRIKPKIGDILISKVGRVGAVAIFEKELECAIGRNLVIIRPNNQLIKSSFLIFLMRSYLFRKEIIRLTHLGSIHKSLHVKNIFKLNIPLPPLSEQRNIAFILSTVQDAIEKTEKVIQATQELKKSLMDHLFTYGPVPITEREQVQLKETEIGEIPEEWELSKISDLATVNKISRNPATDSPFDYFTYIDISSVEGETGRITETVQMLGKNAPSRARRVVHSRDVIMSTVRPYLKAFTIIPKEYNNQICSTGYAVLTAKKHSYPEYLFYYLFTVCAQTQFKQFMRGSNYPAINAGHVKDTIIPFPSLNIQKQIANYFTEIDKKIITEKNKKMILEEMFKSFLENLMTGKIRAKDLNFKNLESVEMGL